MNCRRLRISAAVLTVVATLAMPPIRAVVAAEMDISSMIATAKTASDHEAIATYYKQQAAEARAKVALHKKMAEQYSMAKPGPNTKTHFHEHCEALIRSYEGQAKEYDGLAKVHEDLAAKAGK